MNVTMLAYPKNLEGSITILGEKGTVRIGGVAVNEIQHWEFAEPREDDAKVADASYETTSVYGFGHPLYYDNVIKVLRGEAEPETDGREGLRSLEVLIAAYLSARDGRRVSLPLDYLTMGFQTHETAIVDEGARIGEGTRIWHWVHVCGGAGSASAARSARTSIVGNDVVIGNNVQDPEQRLGLRRRDAGGRRLLRPSMVFTNVYNPRAASRAQGRVPRRRW